MARIFHFFLEIEFNALRFISYTMPRLCSTYVVATLNSNQTFLYFFIDLVTGYCLYPVKSLTIPRRKFDSQPSSVFEVILLTTHCCFGFDVTWNSSIRYASNMPLRRISSLGRNHSQRVSKYSLARRTISCHRILMNIGLAGLSNRDS